MRVRFLKSWRSYRVGDRADLPDKTARLLIDSGVCVQDMAREITETHAIRYVFSDNRLVILDLLANRS